MLEKIKSFFKNQGAGFYVYLASFIVLLIGTIAYSFIDKSILNGSVLAIGWVLLIVSIPCSLFSVTSVIAPSLLMVASLSMLANIILADGFIDYISTFFFDGISISTIFSLPLGLLIPVLTIIITLIVSSVAMYLSFTKKKKAKEETHEEN